MHLQSICKNCQVNLRTQASARFILTQIQSVLPQRFARFLLLVAQSSPESRRRKSKKMKNKKNKILLKSTPGALLRTTTQRFFNFATPKFAHVPSLLRTTYDQLYSATPPLLVTRRIHLSAKRSSFHSKIVNDIAVFSTRDTPTRAFATIAKSISGLKLPHDSF